MHLLVPIVMFAWIPVVLGLFALLPPRRAVIVAFLAAWLFLPVVGYRITGFPDYTKMSATCVGVLLGSVLFTPNSLLSLRPRWFDLPIAVWCACPLFSSLSNSLGFYDGLAVSLGQFVAWGLPYIIGRAYFSDLEGLRELAIGMFVGGVLYIPICLFEVRMSPQLHAIFYGYQPAGWHNVRRFGGWRPAAFMQDGLMVGMWMATASLAGIWLWVGGTVRKVKGVPASYIVLALLATTVLCKSLGALLLLGLGLAVLYVGTRTRSVVPLLGLMAIAPMYAGLRVSGNWSGDQLVSLVSEAVDSERAASLKARLRNEDLLSAKAMERPVFGWGGWSRNRVRDERGRDIATTDGLWIIVLGRWGLVGLVALIASLLGPSLRLCWRTHVADWRGAELAPAAALAVILAICMIDHLPNGMVNPVYTLAAGGLMGLRLGCQSRLPAARRRRTRGTGPAPIALRGPQGQPTG